VGDHESLAGLLGGAAAQHYHLTAIQEGDLTNGGTITQHGHQALIDTGETGAQYTKDAALEVYWNAIKEGETISGAWKATNAFIIGATTQVDGILDEDDMATDSATKLATQQSIKAYVRDNAGDPGQPKLDFYQDWLQDSKYLNSTVVTMVDATTLTNVGNTTMDFNIEEKRWDFTIAEVFESSNLYDSDLSMSSIVEAIMHFRATDSGTPVIEISSDGGSNWETVTDLTLIVEFGTPGLDLRIRYTAGGTGYLEHTGVLYNQSDKANVPAPQPSAIYHNGTAKLTASADGATAGVDPFDLNVSNGEVGVRLNANGAVSLHQNKNMKLTTHSAGIEITDDGIGTDGLKVSVSSGDNVSLAVEGNDNILSVTCKDTGGTPRTVIQCDGNGPFILPLGQLQFPATANPSTNANTLDDYEEGTWTPLAADSAVGGHSSNSGSGTYTKTGRTVTVHGSITSIDTTGLTSTEELYIQGLPFTVGAGDPIGSVLASDVTFAGYISALPIGGTGAIYFWDSPPDAGISDVRVSDFDDDSSSLWFTATYEI
jgi:hypothetical protein